MAIMVSASVFEFLPAMPWLNVEISKELFNG